MNKIFMAVFGLLFFIANICSAYAPAGKLYVTMLDVGQGDAFLVETPSQNVLIDTGDVDRSDELVAELKNAGFTRFEQIILTHPHADHIGGVNSILGNFTVDTISDNGIVATSPLYLQYHTAEVKINTLKTGDVVDLGGGVKFKVLYPSASFVSDVNRGKRKVNYNDTSIVGKLIFGDFSVLFTGDAGKFVEDTLRENFQADLKSTILKAGHHGAKTSSTSEFINVVNPDYVFISAGNSFGHPSKETLRNLRANFVLPENIFCTRFNGAVRVESDGKNYFITLEQGNDWIEEYSGERVTVTRLD